jgi:hypothetical protein
MLMLQPKLDPRFRLLRCRYQGDWTLVQRLRVERVRARCLGMLFLYV